MRGSWLTCSREHRHGVRRPRESWEFLIINHWFGLCVFYYYLVFRKKFFFVLNLPLSLSRLAKTDCSFFGKSYQESLVLLSRNDSAEPEPEGGGMWILRAWLAHRFAQNPLPFWEVSFRWQTLRCRSGLYTGQPVQFSDLVLIWRERGGEVERPTDLSYTDSFVASFILGSHLLFRRVCCVCICAYGMAHMWRSEENWWELVLSAVWLVGIEVRSSDLYLCPLSHLISRFS